MHPARQIYIFASFSHLEKIGFHMISSYQKMPKTSFNIGEVRSFFPEPEFESFDLEANPVNRCKFILELRSFNVRSSKKKYRSHDRNHSFFLSN